MADELDLSASVVGRSNADQASKRLFSVCNNHRLKYVLTSPSVLF